VRVFCDKNSFTAHKRYFTCIVPAT
jgi:hypothetical protein